MAFPVEANKAFAPLLVESAADVIQSIWSQFPPSNPPVQQLPPQALRRFISEVLLRSKASYSTAYLSLLYLSRLKPTLTNSLGSYPCQNMFLAALVVASKYLQDSCYSNASWAALTGIPAQEITLMERLFLRLLDFNLHVREEEFDAWSQFITMHMTRLHTAYVSMKKQRAAEAAAATAAAALLQQQEQLRSLQQQPSNSDAQVAPNSPAISGSAAIDTHDHHHHYSHYPHSHLTLLQQQQLQLQFQLLQHPASTVVSNCFTSRKRRSSGVEESDPQLDAVARRPRREVA